jgi:hypothetical protein
LNKPSAVSLSVLFVMVLTLGMIPNARALFQAKIFTASLNSVSD